MDNDELMIEELPGLAEASFKPFARPYYQRLKGFMGVRASHAHATFPKGTFAPGACPKAYKFPEDNGDLPKVEIICGIGSLGGNIPKSDVTKFCQENGYPTPNLKLIAIPGANTTNDPGGANVENNLDWQCVMQAWHRKYPKTPCNIIMCFGPNTDKGIADVTTALVAQGCKIVSWSWGAAKSQWTPAAITYTDAAFSDAQSKGVFLDAASGDNSINDGTGKRAVDYPCASPYVWAVGGTSLTVNAAGDFLNEKAWGDGKPGDEGGGGGFSDTPIPAWQQTVVPGSFRGVPDSSANAAPETGYQIISDGAWSVIGGTSASAPLTGGLAGVILSMGGSDGDFQTKLYANRKLCFTDCVVGSNGDQASSGWDSATGNGSPIGTAIASVLGVGAPPVPTPIPPPVTPPPTTAATVTLSQSLLAGTYILTKK